MNERDPKSTKKTLRRDVFFLFFFFYLTASIATFGKTICTINVFVSLDTKKVTLIRMILCFTGMWFIVVYVQIRLMKFLLNRFGIFGALDRVFDVCKLHNTSFRFLTFNLKRIPGEL